jgi:hypothetical protein
MAASFGQSRRGVLLHRGGDGRRELADSSVEASGIRFLYDGSFFMKSLSLGRATPSRMRLGDGRWEARQETKVQELRNFCNRKVGPTAKSGEARWFSKALVHGRLGVPNGGGRPFATNVVVGRSPPPGLAWWTR